MEHLNYLFQGKLLSAELSKQRTSFLFKVLVPKNVNGYAVGEPNLFEEVLVDFQFQTLIIGTLNNNTSEVTLEDNEEILSAFSNRVFRGDYGDPELCGVDDVTIPTLINVHFDIPSKKVYFVIPTENKQLPFIRVTYNEISLTDTKGKKLDIPMLIEEMRIFYEDHYLSNKDRRRMEWEHLHDIKNSVEFYSNKLSSHWAYKKEINSEYKELTFPLWIEVENVKWNEFGYIDTLTILRATKNKQQMKIELKKEVFWIQPKDYAATLTFISNELINSDSDNPFQEVIDLYFSKWEPNEIIDQALPHDLLKIINADEVLSVQHPNKEKFFKQLDYWIEERKLVLV
jgi:hypothetical protein